jgi:hypothetical protein
MILTNTPNYFTLRPPRDLTGFSKFRNLGGRHRQAVFRLYLEYNASLPLKNYPGRLWSGHSWPLVPSARFEKLPFGRFVRLNNPPADGSNCRNAGGRESETPPAFSGLGGTGVPLVQAEAVAAKIIPNRNRFVIQGEANQSITTPKENP